MPKPIKDLKVEIPQSVLKKLLTESELRMLKNRWQIIALLEKGLSIRQIAARLNVGTDTVVRVSKLAKTRKINSLEKVAKTIGYPKTSWVFGKGHD